MTKQLADELEALGEKATPGPWKAGRSDMISTPVYNCGETHHSGKYVYREGGPHKDTPAEAFLVTEPNAVSDAQLIVALRNNLPAIVSALRENENLREALGKAPIPAKYHGAHGFELERFIADYETFVRDKLAALAAGKE